MVRWGRIISVLLRKWSRVLSGLNQKILPLQSTSRWGLVRWSVNAALMWLLQMGATFEIFDIVSNRSYIKEWDGLVRVAFVRKNKTLSAAFKWVSADWKHFHLSHSSFCQACHVGIKPPGRLQWNSCWRRTIEFTALCTIWWVMVQFLYSYWITQHNKPQMYPHPLSYLPSASLNLNSCPPSWQEVPADFSISQTIDSVLQKANFSEKRARSMDIDDFMV